LARTMDLITWQGILTLGVQGGQRLYPGRRQGLRPPMDPEAAPPRSGVRPRRRSADRHQGRGFRAPQERPQGERCRSAADRG